MRDYKKVIIGIIVLIILLLFSVQSCTTLNIRNRDNLISKVEKFEPSKYSVIGIESEGDIVYFTTKQLYEKGVITENDYMENKDNIIKIEYVNNTKIKAYIVELNNLPETKIVLNGNSNITLEYGTSYIEEGILSAHDVKDGDIKSNVKINDNINYEKLGNYKISYSIKNSLGKETTVVRNINIVDTIKPVINISRECNHMSHFS